MAGPSDHCCERAIGPSPAVPIRFQCVGIFDPKKNALAYVSASWGFGFFFSTGLGVCRFDLGPMQ